MKSSKRATNSLNDDQMEELNLWNSFAGKASLKINSLVKTPLHEFMAVERSGLWAPEQANCVFAGFFAVIAGSFVGQH